jgi:hypothetical protein
MASRIVLIDDLDGSEPADTVTFGIDGAVYEIELSEEHIAQLWTIYEPYVKAGRRRR